MELYFKVKAQNDLEAKRIARNMAIETLRNKGMMGRWFEVQNVEWIQKGLFGDGVLAKVHVYVKDKKTMKDNQYKKIKAFLAQEFKDVKAMLKKKNFKDFIVSNTSVGDFDIFISNNGGTLGYIIKKKGSNNTIEERFGFSNSAEAMTAGKEAVSKLNRDARFRDAIVDKYRRNGYLLEFYKNGDVYGYYISKNGMHILHQGGYDTFKEAFNSGVREADARARNNDAKVRDERVELKLDGRTIGYVEADTLLDAVRIYERQHPEHKGRIDAYMADRRFSDSSLDDFLGDLYDNGVQSKRELVRYPVERKDVDEARARQMVNKFAQEIRNAELPIRDAISYDKGWAERMFLAGYSARETAMRMDEYQRSENNSERVDLIRRLEQHRDEFFRRRLMSR